MTKPSPRSCGSSPQVADPLRICMAIPKRSSSAILSGPSSTRSGSQSPFPASRVAFRWFLFRGASDGGPEGAVRDRARCLHPSWGLGDNECVGAEALSLDGGAQACCSTPYDENVRVVGGHGGVLGCVGFESFSYFSIFHVVPSALSARLTPRVVSLFLISSAFL